MCGVKIMSLHHGWGWQPPHTTSHTRIHVRHTQQVWAHSYALNRHTVSALYIYTRPSWPMIYPSHFLVESKSCHYIMVVADSHLKLFPTTILNIYRMFEHIHIYAVHRHTVAALHSYGPGFGPSVSCVESKLWHYIMVKADSHLKLLPTSILGMYKVFEHIYMLSIGT